VSRFEVFHAVDRAEATRLVVSGEVDVLITHGHLPGDHSPCEYAVAASLRRPGLLIVVVTSGAIHDQPFSPTRARTLQKPFDVVDLLAAITDARSLVSEYSAFAQFESDVRHHHSHLCHDGAQELFCHAQFSGPEPDLIGLVDVDS
jgi:hypothetical protein